MWRPEGGRRHGGRRITCYSESNLQGELKAVKTRILNCMLCPLGWPGVQGKEEPAEVLLDLENCVHLSMKLPVPGCFGVRCGDGWTGVYIGCYLLL